MTEKKNESATENDGNVKDVKSPEQNKANEQPAEEQTHEVDLGIDTPAEAARKSAKAFDATQKARKKSAASKEK